MQWLKWFGKKDKAPSGVTRVDAFVEDATQTIVRIVEDQMSAVEATQEQLTFMRPFLTGYIATLAEQFSLASERADAKNVTLLISLRAAQNVTVVSGDAKSLAGDLAVYIKNQDFEFCQGGAVALEDFARIRHGDDACGLLECFPPKS